VILSESPSLVVCSFNLKDCITDLKTMDWQLPSKAPELLWTRKMRDYLRYLIIWAHLPLLWSMTIQPVVGVYCLYPVNDNISKMRTKRCKIQTLKLSLCWFDDTNYI